MAHIGSLSGRNLPGGYVLGELLGRGGMGSVYEGTHLASRRPVAIKVLNPKLARHPAHLERFRREAEMTSSLGHPNLVSVEFFDHQSTDLAFYVMERLRGEPLSRITNREGRVSPERAVDIIAQTLSGLDAAHRAGVIHRDLKPSNIFIVPGRDGKEHVKVVDFGLAKLLTSDATKLTVTGSVVGTPHYLSPEQALGQATDTRSDLFACGVVLYELLAGVRPFEGQDIAELIQKIARAETTRVEEVAPEVTTRLADAVHRALARNPADRFGSATQMQSVLLESVGRRSAFPRKKKRSRIPMAAIVAIASVLGVIVAVSVAAGLTFFAGGQNEDDDAEVAAYAPPVAVTPILDQTPSTSGPLMEPTGTAVPAAAPTPEAAPSAPQAPPPSRPSGTATAAPPAGGGNGSLSPPPALAITECDVAARQACACADATLRPSMCQSAHEVVREWRAIIAASAQNRPVVVQSCRSWGAEIARVCRP